jgi:hypothetical protein
METRRSAKWRSVEVPVNPAMVRRIGLLIKQTGMDQEHVLVAAIRSGLGELEHLSAIVRRPPSDMGMARHRLVAWTELRELDDAIGDQLALEREAITDGDKE